MPSLLDPAGGHKRQKKSSPFFLPSSLYHLSFTCSEPEICPLAHFPNSLRFGFKSQRLGPGMPPPPVFRGKPLCVHTHSCTHTPHGSPECPVIRHCFDLDTHREESTNDYTHTGGCSLYAGMYTKGIHSLVSPLIHPLTLVHTSHTRHTPQCLAVINLQEGVSGF